MATPQLKIADCVKSIQHREGPLTIRLQSYQKMSEYCDSEGVEAHNVLLPLLSGLIPALEADIMAPNEEIAVTAMKLMTYFFHHEIYVTSLANHQLTSVTTTVANSIMRTPHKKLCSYGAVFLREQRIPEKVLVPLMEPILHAILHLINNPMGSKAISFDGCNALQSMAAALPTAMAAVSEIWVPSLCCKLLVDEKLIREIVLQVLEDLRPNLFPASNALREAVTGRVRDGLLVKMEEMVTEFSHGLRVARAWTWLVRFMTGRLFDKMPDGSVLVNRLLKIPETTFVSANSGVRIATLVAWEALVESLLTTNKQSTGSPSLKRVILLMMPLTNSLKSEKEHFVRVPMFRTWLSLVHHLGPWAFKPDYWDSVISPILSLILSPHRKSAMDPSAAAAAAAGHLSDTLTAGALEFIKHLLERNVVETMDFEGSQWAGEMAAIAWQPWELCQLDSVIKLVSMAAAHQQNSFLEIWKLLLRGLAAAGKAAIRPSPEHVTAVHSVMRFVRHACLAGRQVSDADLAWGLFSSAVEELGSFVVASTFYRMALGPVLVETGSLTGNGPGEEDLVITESSLDPGGGGGSSTPGGRVNIGFYLAAVWLQIRMRGVGEDLPQMAEFRNQIQHLTAVAMHGQDSVLGAVLLSQSLKQLAKVAESLSPGQIRLVVSSWEVLAGHLESHLTAANDLKDVALSKDCSASLAHSLLSTPVEILASLEKPLASKAPDWLTATVAEMVSTWLKLAQVLYGIAQVKLSEPNQLLASLVAVAVTAGDHGRKVWAPVQSFEVEVLLWALQNVALSGAELQKGTKRLSRGRVVTRASMGSGSGLGSVVALVAGRKVVDTFFVDGILRRVSRTISSLLSPNPISSNDEKLDRLLVSISSFLSKSNSHTVILLTLSNLMPPLKAWLDSASSQSMAAIPQLQNSSRRLSELWLTLLSALLHSVPAVVFDSALLDFMEPVLLLALDRLSTDAVATTLSFWKLSFGLSGPALLNSRSSLQIVLKKAQAMADSMPSPLSSPPVKGPATAAPPAASAPRASTAAPLIASPVPATAAPASPAAAAITSPAAASPATGAITSPATASPAAASPTGGGNIAAKTNASSTRKAARLITMATRSATKPTAAAAASSPGLTTAPAPAPATVASVPAAAANPPMDSASATTISITAASAAATLPTFPDSTPAVLVIPAAAVPPQVTPLPAAVAEADPGTDNSAAIPATVPLPPATQSAATQVQAMDIDTPSTVRDEDWELSRAAAMEDMTPEGAGLTPAPGSRKVGKKTVERKPTRKSKRGRKSSGDSEEAMESSAVAEQRKEEEKSEGRGKLSGLAGGSEVRTGEEEERSGGGEDGGCECARTRGIDSRVMTAPDERKRLLIKLMHDLGMDVAGREPVQGTEQPQMQQVQRQEQETEQTQRQEEEQGQRQEQGMVDLQEEEQRQGKRQEQGLQERQEEEQGLTERQEEEQGIAERQEEQEGMTEQQEQGHGMAEGQEQEGKKEEKGQGEGEGQEQEQESEQEKARVGMQEEQETETEQEAGKQEQQQEEKLKQGQDLQKAKEKEQETSNSAAGTQETETLPSGEASRYRVESDLAANREPAAMAIDEVGQKRSREATPVIYLPAMASEWSEGQPGETSGRKKGRSGGWRGGRQLSGLAKSVPVKTMPPRRAKAKYQSKSKETAKTSIVLQDSPDRNPDVTPCQLEPELTAAAMAADAPPAVPAEMVAGKSILEALEDSPQVADSPEGDVIMTDSWQPTHGSPEAIKSVEPDTGSPAASAMADAGAVSADLKQENADGPTALQLDASNDQTEAEGEETAPVDDSAMEATQETHLVNNSMAAVDGSLGMVLKQTAAEVKRVSERLAMESEAVLPDLDMGAMIELQSEVVEAMADVGRLQGLLVALSAALSREMKGK